MNKFNLKKIDSRKKLYFKNNNFIYRHGGYLINDKLKFLKKKPQKTIVIGNEVNLNDNLNKPFNYEEIENISKLENSIDGIISNFNFQLKILTEEKNLFYELYKLLKKDGFLCFNLLTKGSMETLKKMFMDIDINIFGGVYERFGPFYEIQDIIDRLSKSNFREIVVGVDELEIQYNSLMKLRHDFKEIGTSNFYENEYFFKRDFLKKVQIIFDKIIKKYEYIPMELKIATFTAWK